MNHFTLAQLWAFEPSLTWVSSVNKVRLRFWVYAWNFWSELQDVHISASAWVRPEPSPELSQCEMPNVIKLFQKQYLKLLHIKEQAWVYCGKWPLTKKKSFLYHRKCKHQKFIMVHIGPLNGYLSANSIQTIGCRHMKSLLILLCSMRQEKWAISRLCTPKIFFSYSEC